MRPLFRPFALQTRLRPSVAIGRDRRVFLSTQALLRRQFIKEEEFSSGDSGANRALAQELLTEAYCWDHSSPNTGHSQLVLDADPTADITLTPTTPFPAGIDPTLTYLDTIRQDSQREFPETAFMMVSPQSGLACYWLITLTKARRILELGSLNGYSTFWLAEALKRNCREAGLAKPPSPVVACELRKEFAQSIERQVTKYNMQDWLEVRQGPALDTLRAIPAGTQFDFIFLDANKNDYINYYEQILAQDLLAPGGVLAVDNVLFYDAVYTKYPPVQKVYQQLAKDQGLVSLPPHKGLPNHNPPKYLYDFNAHVAQDPRTEQIVLPLFDGLTLIRRK
ncbi:hypothetical protein IWQ60_001833 [Tieghemiomyces parasiticus]|uniref:O-methyltransferase n=1 Tax=Tieghemiomyces parasiticus TaxID=78921 RepID=A0A9W8ADV2_9FUNG|nr:hypothetical protein IWQ60_001833 [Tieghemiomyces parasiticus]